jgi:Protein of unknown function (DUF3142)
VVTACSSNAQPLGQDAYVWQRNWTPSVSAAVATAPAAIGGLRVLVAESADAPLTILPVDLRALADAHRPVTLVVRIDGSRPVGGLSLAPVIAAAEQWKAAGVTVAGIEIDHDCATARLPDYAAWLIAHRPARLRYSITALPTWAGSPVLRDVAAAVDEIVVQVHAVRAPAIFEPARARSDLAAFSAAVPTARLRVALPTYRARVNGRLIEVEPEDVVAFVDQLARSPIANLEGIVWFRLPVIGDDTTWTGDAFAAVIENRTRGPSDVRVALRSRGNDLYDIVATNPTAGAVEFPALRLDGDLVDAELVAGYSEHGSRRFKPPHRRLAAGHTQDIGWVRGKAPRVAID